MISQTSESIQRLLDVYHAIYRVSIKFCIAVSPSFRRGVAAVDRQGNLCSIFHVKKAQNQYSLEKPFDSHDTQDVHPSTFIFSFPKIMHHIDRGLLTLSALKSCWEIKYSAIINNLGLNIFNFKTIFLNAK